MRGLNGAAYRSAAGGRGLIGSLERAYSVLMAHPHDAWRTENQALYVDLREAIAAARDCSGEEVQTEFEEALINGSR